MGKRRVSLSSRSSGDRRERETQRRGRNSGVSGQDQAMGWGRHGRQEIAQEVLRE